MNNFKKSILFSIASIIITSSVFAQNLNKIKPGDHVVNKSIEQFEGVWQSENNDFVLELNLSKVAIPLGTAKIDGIIGYHKLEVGKKVISKSLKPADQKEIFKKATFSAKGIQGKENSIDGYFILDKNATRYKVLGNLSPSRNELVLTLIPSNPKGITINKEKTVDVYKLPGSITFKKKI